MKLLKSITSLIIICAALGFQTNSYALEGDNSIKFTGGFNNVGSLFLVDYERMIADQFAVGGRVGFIDYEVEDGSYTENGDGNGLEATFRWYPKADGFNGFFIGGALGFWNTDWSWTDPNDSPTRGSGSSFAFNINFNLGWKFGFGSSPVYIEPSLIAGNFFSIDTTDDTGTEEYESDLGIYAALALAIGFTF